MHRIKTRLVITIILAELFATQSFAYEINVHSPLCKAAISHSQLNKILDNVGYSEGSEYYLKQTDNDGNIIKSKSITTWISDGGKTEDAGKSGQDDFLTTRAFNHFHDPLQPWDNAFFHNAALTSIYSVSYGRQPVSALIWGLKPGSQDFTQNTTGDWSWSKARQALYDSLTASTQPSKDNHLADCMRALGQLMHLVQDMSVPAHTRNDTHVLPLTKIPFTDWGLEKPILGPWHYETYTWNWQKNHAENFSEFLTNLSPVSPDPVVFSPPSNPDPQYESVAPFSGLFDRNIYTNASSPPSLESNTVGLAEYTNANFFSLDTIWEYPHPAKAETDYRIAIRKARDGGSDTVLHIYRSSETQLTNPISTVRYFAEELYAGNPEIKTDFLDDDVFHGYAMLLIPRAVGYSAALIDYFFRGVIEVTLPQDTDPLQIIGTSASYNHVTLQVQNTSPAGEGITDGTIELSVRYKLPLIPSFDTYPAPPPPSADYHYIQATGEVNGLRQINRDTPDELVFDLPDDGIPVNAVDIRFQVIYRGQLGQEEDGIATGGVNLPALQDPVEVTVPDTGYYALASGDQATDFHQTLTLQARNRVPGDLEMTNGGISLAVKYRLSLAGNSFINDPGMAIEPDYVSFELSEFGNIVTIPRDAPVQLSFDLSNNPIPMNAVDLVMQIRFTDASGQVVYTGMKDISEPSPIDVFNTGDVVCINQQWYTAGSQEAIDLVDVNQDGIAWGWNEEDVYPHNFKNIYWLFSSIAAPAEATVDKYDFKIEYSIAPEHLRLGYILTDYTYYNFSRSEYQSDPLVTADEWHEHAGGLHLGPMPPQIFSGTGFMNQMQFIRLPHSNGLYRSISPLSTLRGIITWNPYFIVNGEVGYPPCDYGAIPK